MAIKESIKSKGYYRVLKLPSGISSTSINVGIISSNSIGYTAYEPIPIGGALMWVKDNNILNNIYVNGNAIGISNSSPSFVNLSNPVTKIEFDLSNNMTWRSGSSTPISVTSIVSSPGKNIVVAGVDGNSANKLYWATAVDATWNLVSGVQGASGGVSANAWYAGNYFFSEQYSVKYYSTDGITWTSRGFGQAGANSTPKWGYGSRYFMVAVNNISTSEDGINWTTRSTNLAQGDHQAVAGMPGMHIIGGGSRFLYSADALTWTSAPLPSPGNGFNSVISGDGIFVAAMGNGGLYTSTNGSSWTQRTLYWSTTTQVRKVIYAPGQTQKYLAIGTWQGNGGSSGGSVNVSTDGITWTTRGVHWSSSSGFNNAVYGGRVFNSYAVLTNNISIYWSTNATAFLQQGTDIHIFVPDSTRVLS
jgi:hypothetical protein